MSAREKIRLEFTGVDDSGWTQLTVNTPLNYAIKRARAEIISGSGTKAVIRVREADSADDIDTVLEYDIASVTHPLDSIEDILVVPYTRTAVDSQVATTYVECKTDNAVDTDTVRVVLDIEG